MTGSGITDVTDACAFVRARLGESPAVIGVAERGTLAVGELLDDSQTSWQPENSGPAAFKVFAAKVDEIPLAVVLENPPFLPARHRTFPVEFAAQWHCPSLVVTGTAISLNTAWRTEGIMVVEDHINLLGDTPLIGWDSAHATRFLDMRHAYDATLRDLAVRAGEAERQTPRKGVFVASPLARSHESAALDTLRDVGGDACGTGIVPHVLAARKASLAVLALAALTGPGKPASAPDSSSPSFQASGHTVSRLTSMVRRLVREYFSVHSG